jgi:hypothetical protein
MFINEILQTEKTGVVLEETAKSGSQSTNNSRAWKLFTKVGKKLQNSKGEPRVNS